MDILSNLPRLILMALLLCLSFFFSGSETALFSLSREDLHRFRHQEGRIGALIGALRDDPKGLLITILFGNMLVNVLFYSNSFVLLSQIGHAVTQTIAGFCFLLTVIICGEVTPKAVAVCAPCRFARVVAIPITVFKKVTFPIRLVLSGIIDVFVGILGRKPRDEKHVSADELKMLVNLSQKAGTIGRGERTMINEIIEFAAIRANQVMTHRVDATLFELSGSPEEFRELICRTRHSKVPVYKEDIDNIVGVIHAKDVFLYPEKKLEDLVRPIPFIPESKTIESLLRQFREEKIQMAVVVDEYGGFEGIVALEDILEEIVGDIEDEFDAGGPLEAVPPVRAISEGTYLLSGDLSMREWAELFGDDLMLPGVNTLGGFVTTLLGRVPREGDRVTYNNLFFVVRKMRRRRVAQLLLMSKPGALEDEVESEEP